ncbi:shugoshin like [Lecanosticta acicola]|uniref:Shugoshin like n=1 Tax=Lecanosticta acicola TaxID=111012 RepID=A0AAI8YYP2_9PEZI|nr:shugoshin like [Lecanosticta acicola]
MARLNEPGVAPATDNGNAIATTATGESLEALKRRFIRQNRELAKNNSSQSLRIRNLELEVSRLLVDNLDLREQVLSLQNEVENARRQASGDAIRQMKQDMRMKIAELSGLVDGFADELPDERSVPDKERILSPSRQQYRERQPLADLMQEAVMPTILEDKQHPRKTLDPEEIRAIRLSDQSGTTGSPDLGPPPVVHFDMEDPIKLNRERDTEAKESTGISPKPENEELLPSVNLETRRRRRDSKLDIRRHSILALSPVNDGESGTTMLRTGAKRKLSDRETEKPIKPPSQGDFTFSRKASADQSCSDEEKPKLDKEQQPDEPEQSVAPPVLEPSKPVRKILGEKSVNMSPKKTTTRASRGLKEDIEKPAPPKPAANRERPPSRGRRASSIPTPAPQDDPVPTFEVPPPEPSTEEQLQAKTPAPSVDIFSPATSEPWTSGKMNEARDTPPPPQLSSASNTTEGGQRPSRRSRPPISYTEPSLIAKMRRPDDKKVDAITGLKNPQRPLNPSADRRSIGGMPRSSLSGSITIKREPVEDDNDWKGTSHPSLEEGSPLRERSTDQHPPAAETVAENLPSSSSSSPPPPVLPSALPAYRKRRDQPEREEPASKASLTTTFQAEPEPSSPDAMAKKMEELELYDFKDSSSPGSVEGGGTERTRKEKAGGGRQRRHSSVPKDLVKEKEKEKETGSDAAAGRGGSARLERSSRRRSMMV